MMHTHIWGLVERERGQHGRYEETATGGGVEGAEQMGAGVRHNLLFEKNFAYIINLQLSTSRIF